MRGRHQRESRGQDFHDVHHLYYPRKAYRGMPAAKFRNLPCHKVRLHRTVHNEIHAVVPPPRKPTTAQMMEAIARHDRGECPCGRRE